MYLDDGRGRPTFGLSPPPTEAREDHNVWHGRKQLKRPATLAAEFGRYHF